MSSYLVRLKKTQESWSEELVGIFEAQTREILCHLVDECVSPLKCEYRKLCQGGVFWPTKACKLPIDDWETLEMGQAAFTEGWASSLEDDSGKWKDFETEPFAHAYDALDNGPVVVN